MMYKNPCFTQTISMDRRYENRDIFLNFLKCGLAGWCMEILVTSAESAMNGDWRLMGRTSVWMFPIYGMGVLLGPITGLADRWIGDADTLNGHDRIWRHGLQDMVLIFLAEYLTGSLLRKLRICPWDYSGRRFHVNGLIRLDFAPFWFGAGLLFERITGGKH